MSALTRIELFEMPFQEKHSHVCSWSDSDTFENKERRYKLEGVCTHYAIEIHNQLSWLANAWKR